MIDQPSVGFLLHDLARQFRLRFDAQARHLGVTRPQWRALLHLARAPGQTQAELADRLEVERISLCRMVDRMSDAGLVERRADPRDRRVWRLHLTARAGALVEKLTALGLRLEDEVLAILDPAERKAFKTVLVKLDAGLRALDDGKVAA